MAELSSYPLETGSILIITGEQTRNTALRAIRKAPVELRDNEASKRISSGTTNHGSMNTHHTFAVEERDIDHLRSIFESYTENHNRFHPLTYVDLWVIGRLTCQINAIYPRETTREDIGPKSPES